MSGFHDFSTLLGSTLETKQGQKPTNEVLAGKDVDRSLLQRPLVPALPRLHAAARQVLRPRSRTPRTLKLFSCRATATRRSSRSTTTSRPPGRRCLSKIERPKTRSVEEVQVRGIPTLVILDGKTGETITLDGRDGVSSEPEERSLKPPSVPTFSRRRPSSTRRAKKSRCPKDRGRSSSTSRRTGARPAAASRPNLLNFFPSSRRSIRTYRSSVRNTTRARLLTANSKIFTRGRRRKFLFCSLYDLRRAPPPPRRKLTRHTRRAPPSPSSRPIKIARRGRRTTSPWASGLALPGTMPGTRRRSSRRPLVFRHSLFGVTRFRSQWEKHNHDVW